MALNFESFVSVCIETNISAEGQLISKAFYSLLTSPKKGRDKFVLFAFLLFTANKSNSGESIARQSVFWFYLTFSACRLGDVLGQQKRKQMAQPLVESFFLKIEMKN